MGAPEASSVDKRTVLAGAVAVDGFCKPEMRHVMGMPADAAAAAVENLRTRVIPRPFPAGNKEDGVVTTVETLRLEQDEVAKLLLNKVKAKPVTEMVVTAVLPGG
jgi:hypothetical protein